MKATKQTILMLTPETHLRLKVTAVATRRTMGELIKALLDRLDPGPHSIDDDLKFLKNLEMFRSEEAAELKAANINELEIVQEAK